MGFVFNTANVAAAAAAVAAVAAVVVVDAAAAAAAAGATAVKRVAGPRSDYVASGDLRPDLGQEFGKNQTNHRWSVSKSRVQYLGQDNMTSHKSKLPYLRDGPRDRDLDNSLYTVIHWRRNVMNIWKLRGSSQISNYIPASF